MKAKVIETGEIIDVKCLYPTTYSRLDCNNKIIEEFDEDELEFLPNPNAKTYGDKLKNLEIDIKTTDDKIRLFYKWLNEHELQCQKDKDVDSARLFASIKSMFIDIFGYCYKN